MCVIGMRGDARSDRRRAHVDFTDQQRRLPQPLLILAEHHGVGAELLAERHRHRILQLRASHFQNVLELLRLCFESAPQNGHRVDADARMPNYSRDFQRRGIDIVGALANVDMFIGCRYGVFAFLRPQEFERAVGDHLVGIHVGRRPGAALNDVDHKLIMQLAFQQFRAGADDGVATRRVEQTQLMIRLCGGLFDASERLDQLRVYRDRRTGNRKIFQRT